MCVRRCACVFVLVCINRRLARRNEYVKCRTADNRFFHFCATFLRHFLESSFTLFFHVQPPPSPKLAFAEPRRAFHAFSAIPFPHPSFISHQWPTDPFPPMARYSSVQSLPPPPQTSFDTRNPLTPFNRRPIGSPFSRCFYATPTNFSRAPTATIIAYIDYQFCPAPTPESSFQGSPILFRSFIRTFADRHRPTGRMTIRREMRQKEVSRKFKRGDAIKLALGRPTN